MKKKKGERKKEKGEIKNRLARFCLVGMFFICHFSFFNSIGAQELKVTEFRADITMTDAVKFPMVDYNGEPCGLIRLGLVLPDAHFEGDFIEAVYKEGEWWIYMIKDANYITIKSRQFVPLHYDLPETIKSNVTYVMTVVKKTAEEYDATRTAKVTILVEDERGILKDANVSIDSKPYPLGNKINAELSHGPHTVVCEADNYPTDTTYLFVDKDTVATIHLEQFCARVTIRSNQQDWRYTLTKDGKGIETNKRVTGDRVTRNLVQGEYTVLLRKEGYRSAGTGFTVGSNAETTVFVRLKKERNPWLFRQMPEMGWHFVELGGHWAQGIGGGAEVTYSFVPARIGGYLTAGASFASDNATSGLFLGGAALRLTGNPDGVDWQLYAGGGYSTLAGPLLNFGTRLAWDASPKGFAPWSVTAGALNSQQGWGGTLGISIGLTAAPIYGGYTLIDNAIAWGKERNRQHQPQQNRISTSRPTKDRVAAEGWLSEQQHDFSNHFLEFGGFLLADTVSNEYFGAAVTYAHVSSHLGWYATLGTGGEDILGIGGATLRLTSSDNSKTDWQLYAGLGLHASFLDEELDELCGVLDIGTRFGWNGEKRHALCPWSFSLGGLLSQHSAGAKIGMSWQIGLSIIAVGLVISYADREL